MKATFPAMIQRVATAGSQRHICVHFLLMRVAGLMALVFVAVAANCSRPAADPPQQRTAESQPSAAPTAAAAAAEAPESPPVDACSLLTSEEIATAQGAAVASTTPSTRSEAGIAVSQCYFALPTAADSLSLIVYKKPGRTIEKPPTVLWKEMFHTARPEKIGRDGKPKAQPNPQKIEGIGDEAFWGGGQFGGTLHVLKGDDVFQLSVGGPGDEAKKLESLKSLAGKIAARL